MNATTEGRPGREMCAADLAAAEQALQNVLSSGLFQRAPALKRLLLYLWEHRNEHYGEYAIAVDVLGKRPDFDSKYDATVRVHVSRLRQKLKEFFDSEGQSFAVRLAIPAGGYRLEVQRIDPDPVSLPVAPPTVAPAQSSPWHPAFVASLVACVLLLGSSVWLWRENVQRGPARTQVAELPPFWQRALGNGRLTRVVFPTPVFFRVGQTRVRDVTINDPDEISRSSILNTLRHQFGEPAPIQTYSVTSDTLALATLTGLLANRGLPLAIGATRDLSLELFGSDNLLFLGVPPTSPHVQRLLSRTEFYLRQGESEIGVRHPLPGEPSVFAHQSGTNSQTRQGIIAVLPGQAAGTRLILLCGPSTFALASYLASPVTLRELEQFLQKQGQPEFFEMVVTAEVDGFKLLKAKPSAFRVVPASLWK